MIKAFKKKIKLNIMDSKEAEKIFILKKIQKKMNQINENVIKSYLFQICLIVKKK